MSSVAKGTAFEDLVYAAIEAELHAGRLGLAPDSARLFKRKGYYSRDRGSDIIVDISIEVWLPSAPNWSLLWICECKDYKGRIPVDDVEEFKAKLDQITGANRKGVIATRGALQESALTYAHSQGIGVMRILPDEQVEHRLYQLIPGATYPDRLTADKVAQALLSPHYVGMNNQVFGMGLKTIHSNWQTLLSEALSSEN